MAQKIQLAWIDGIQTLPSATPAGALPFQLSYKTNRHYVASS